jgi:hypothetical protein
MVEVLKTNRFTTQRKEQIGKESLILGRTKEGDYVIVWEKDIFRHVKGFTHLMNILHASENRDKMVERFEETVFDQARKTIRHFKWRYQPSGGYHAEAH